MEKYSMKSGLPVWQLPVTDKERVDMRAKCHCFENGHSLCKRYIQDTDYYELDVDLEEIFKNPKVVCKKCFTLWKKKYSGGLLQGRK